MGLRDFFTTASGGTLEDIRRENEEADPSRVLYQTGMGGLEKLQREQTARFQAARAPQAQALGVLGQRAQTLEGGQAMMQAQQAREAAQARAMQAPQAILGGQIGAQAAQGIGGLEQEAAARQAAYLRGIGGMGQALGAEAEERRKLEAVMLQDLQARYAAAMQEAQQQRMREADEQARREGAFLQAVSSGFSVATKGKTK